MSASPALAETRSASSGAVRATVSWSTDGPYPSDLHLKIVRAGATRLDEPVTLAAAGDRYGPRPGENPVAVRDLDGDGEAEVLVDASSGGAHCCTTTKLWYFENGAYRRVEHDWGNASYRLGATLIVGVDDWSYVFTSYVGSLSPVLVLDARLRDVTAQHPRIVERELRTLRRYYAERPSRPVLAAIVANLHSLGCHDAADRMVLRAMRQGVLRLRGAYDERPYGDEYLRVLGELLDAGGYRSRNTDGPVSTIC